MIARLPVHRLIALIALSVAAGAVIAYAFATGQVGSPF
jgi:hypothetical protein